MKKEDIIQRLQIEGIFDHAAKKTYQLLRIEVLEEFGKLLLIEASFVAGESLHTISIVANPLGVFFVPKDWRGGEANPLSFDEASNMDWVEMHQGTPAVWIDGVLYLERS